MLTNSTICIVDENKYSIDLKPKSNICMIDNVG